MAKKTVTITLYTSEILYDIQNKTYLTGRSRMTGQNHEEVAHMQANEDEENENQILRSIGNAIAGLRTKLSEYLVDTGTTATNILIDKEKNLEVSLNMPSNYNAATKETIATNLHQHIVNTSVAEWFTITNKTDAADYVALAASNIEQIREALNKRVRPERTAPKTDTDQETE